jgi:hypothetical protein
MSEKKARLLNDVKSKQYLLIARAGLAVPTQEMPIEQLWEQILTQYEGHVAKFQFSGHLSGLKKEVMFRRTKHLNDEKNIVPLEYFHNGMTLWRKYGEIKRYLQNTISSSWDSLMGPDGNIPSGKNLDDMLLRTRELSFMRDEESKEKRSNKKGGYSKEEFAKHPNWYQLEWVFFYNMVYVLKSLRKRSSQSKLNNGSNQYSFMYLLMPVTFRKHLCQNARTKLDTQQQCVVSCAN